ncbi:hypothetical protein [Arthrobacter sp. PM3]|uniref:hypothetical protein n=1 Tax=Arthrobacter sp. PM3 TaxID=2017685 RepID=UPI000E104C9B|nr:hypothetical protein [Arthrobacter sp. PM3]AXJ09373.1 hypothetical protein CFN17_06895 [Arthrobacter sp. PM3]
MPADSATDDKPKPFLGLNGPQTIGSALAAVTSALVGSFLGVAGTLIGAALGSVIATVGAALYARTLSSAATVAMKNIPQRRRGRLPADDALAAVAAGESDEPPAKRVRRPMTPKTWIRVGAVSAAAFVVAMVGLTAVEFGTHKPISSLMSSTSSANGTTGQTTLGAAFSGNQTAPDKTDKPAADPKDVPEQVGDSTKGQGGQTTDVSPSPDAGDGGSTGIQGPGAAQSNPTTPADLTPATEQSPTPAPEPAQTLNPDVSPTSGATEQPAP